MPAETNPGVQTASVQAHDDLISHPDAARGATLTWRSAQCSTQSCIEVADLAEGAALFFTDDEWSAFVTGIKAGEFD